MVSFRGSRWAALVCCLVGLFALPASAQFTANVQGEVQDSTGASLREARSD